MDSYSLRRINDHNVDRIHPLGSKQSHDAERPSLYVQGFDIEALAANSRIEMAFRD